MLLLLLVVFVSLSFISTAYASHGDPVGSCPVPFMIHEIMDHEEHEEHHIGLARDLNGDGWICMYQLSSGRHVHMDNVLP